MTETLGWTKDSGNVDDREYHSYLERVNARFNALTAATPLFEVGLLAGLTPFDIWLSGFEGQERQFHNCHACRSFINHYGVLAVILPDGELESPIWHVEDAPSLYYESVSLMHRAVRRGIVLRPFRHQKPVLGIAETGKWRHMSLSLPRVHLHTRADLTSEQWAAEKRQDFENVSRALTEFSLGNLESVVVLLEGDQLYRGEKLLGAAKWLRDLKKEVADAGGVGRLMGRSHNIIWRAVADAPAGFCHPRSGMLGTLLDDIATGLSFSMVAERFKKKMHPLAYQRPQAPPSEGTIKQAEALFAKLGLTTSDLERRYAHIEEIEAFWRPREDRPLLPVGVFSELLKQPRPPAFVVDTPKHITWVKFVRDALLSADNIELLVPARGPFATFVTAAHEGAQPLFQWNSPFSWYLLLDKGFGRGPDAQSWSLTPGTWVNVNAISFTPPMWGTRPLEHVGKQALFALAGARPPASESLALFPECLRNELHGVRSVIEAYSKTKRIAGREAATATGLMMGEEGFCTAIRLTTGDYRATFKIDRWE